MQKESNPKEDIEFLSSSWNRHEVLDAIRREPRTRRDLKEMTDVSRVTLSRILADLEDRDWIYKANGEYEATTEGDFVAKEITQTLSNMEMVEELGDAMEWLPTDMFDFDLRCLQDAEITVSDWGDHTASTRRVAEIIHGSNRITATASTVSRDVLDAVREATVKGDTKLEAVLDTTALDIISDDSEIQQQFLDVMETDAEIFRYEGDREPLVMVNVCDDTVMMCGHKQEGPPPGTLVTRNERVRSWAKSYFRSIRSDSTPVEMNPEKWAVPTS